MKVLNLSGGGTKFIGIVTAVQTLGEEYDAITGVSAGAIAALPIALGMYDEAIKLGLTIKLKDFMSIAPVKNGKITILGKIRALIGKSFGKQKVDKLISKVITEELFNKYKTGNYPTIYVLAINFSTGTPKVWNIKELEYTEALNVIAASSAIPLMTQGIVIDGYTYYDGGVLDITASSWAITNLKPDEIVSIYSRPYKPLEYKEIKGFLSVLDRTFELKILESNRNDVREEVVMCKNYNVKLRQYFLPDILTNTYDTNQGRLLELHLKTKDIFKKL